ncbi:lipopolysaccharide biosynthesis protein [Schaalia odontolytica]|uniref:lipopolysaccharide biosynthesis protein n=1 Tax=Schaalia odontolytica TaxID=1660 RepID=UPI0028D5B7BF|nr:lipopolysaccharide biosynthesis protein [Schaalia odontolytica]
MSEKDTTASSLPDAQAAGDAPVEATEGALESRGQLGRDYLWNTAASLMSSLAVVIMGVAIVRSGATDSFARAQYGLFTLALAIGQQYQTVGLYEVRTFHVTDVRRRFDFGTYLSTRLLTCLVMVALITYHSWNASTHDPYPAFTVIAAMALLRIFDAFEDVYYSEFQRSGRLDIAGKACFARIFTTTLLWSGLYWFSQDLLLSTLVTFALTCVVLVVAYGLPARGVFSLLPSLNIRGITGILWECLPLFIAAFLNQYLANAPRFAIHASLGDEELGVFAIIYMPAVAINMLSLFVFRPLLTRMAMRWTERKQGEFFSIVRRGLLTTAGAFAVVATVTYVIGAPLLTLVFGTDVSGYVGELMVLVLAGALNAAGVILYYALATMRRLRAVLVAYVAAGATAYVIAPLLTNSHAMMGASLAYAATMGLLAILFTIFMLVPHTRGSIETESIDD